jgi:hypothetical protein
MAVKLIGTYAKKLGLPGYSSHQFSVSVEIEVVNVEDIAGEAKRLYRELQQSVDKEIQQPGFVPPHEYGMNGNGRSQQSQNGNGSTGQPQQERWNCTDGQKGLIQRLVHDNQLDKAEIEAQAQQLFGRGVKQLDKMQASQLIEELLDKTGKRQNGSRWRNNRQRAPRS